jgi:mono/diheme cytochrome c family protein
MLLLAGLAGLGLSTVALGLPWDVDMANGQQRKAYSFDMQPLPEGVVAQPSMTSPKGFAPNYVKGTPDAEALVNPFSGDATVANGKKMFQTYCTPCHGDGVNLGPVAGTPPNRLPGVAVLAGPNGVAHTRSDGYIYLTVRNGGNIMPSYGWAMTDEEMWSVVAYVRTLDNAKYDGPAGGAPAPAPAQPAGSP